MFVPVLIVIKFSADVNWCIVVLRIYILKHSRCPYSTFEHLNRTHNTPRTNKYLPTQAFYVYFFMTANHTYSSRWQHRFATIFNETKTDWLCRHSAAQLPLLQTTCRHRLMTSPRKSSGIHVWSGGQPLSPRKHFRV